MQTKARLGPAAACLAEDQEPSAGWQLPEGVLEVLALVGMAASEEPAALRV
jgi:hypothetical protein